MNLGSFIVLDGPEGGGKTTQVKKLVNRLQQEGVSVLGVREPGGTELSESIRNMLLSVKYKNMSAHAELFLFLAARASLVKEVIKPALTTKTLVLVDRFSPATYAYQACGRGLSKDGVISANDMAIDGVVINLYIRIMVDYDVGLARKKSSGELDRMELEEKEFHQRVYEGYKSFYPKTDEFLEIDANNQSIDEVHEKIYREVRNKFPSFFST